MSKKGRGKQKGNAFEREICRKLSLWFTKNQDDDVFWRSDSSGARATQRFKTKQKTSGQHGDVAAVDEIGIPFTRAITLELKRGYSKFTPFDIIDKAKNGAVQTWENFIIQARNSSEQAGTFAWMIISQRDRRQPIVFMPDKLYMAFKNQGAFVKGPSVEFYFKSKKVGVHGILLRHFFKYVKPEMIKRFPSIYREMQNGHKSRT